MVAEAASGKSKFAQLQAEARRAKRHAEREAVKERPLSEARSVNSEAKQ